MSKDFDSLMHNHVDILREIASIGSGNAVTSLAKMLNKKIKMSVPLVNLPEFKDIARFIGGEENQIVGILVGISGEINGIMMFVIKVESAKTLLEMLLSINKSDTEGFNELELSALEEIGNILCSSYLGSLASLINKKIKPSIPFLSIDMANAILSVPAIEFGKVGDKVLFIESVFVTDKEDVSGYFILVPDMESLETILSSLGVA